MKKKILTILLGFIFMFLLTACELTISENKVNENIGINGIGSLIEIGNDLWYDASTGIVYWWNGNLHNNWAVAPSPYYASNGLPYRYNSNTNTLEEINNLK